jgi:hypothetical protein
MLTSNRIEGARTRMKAFEDTFPPEISQRLTFDWYLEEEVGLLYNAPHTACLVLRSVARGPLTRQLFACRQKSSSCYTITPPITL